MPDGPSFLEWSSRSGLPPKLRDLGPRQREIAAIVYRAAAATPRDVRANLAEPASVRVVRTLLDRMVAKGIVKRRHSGRHNEIMYVAAIATPQVKEAAVKRLVEEQFDGSLSEAAATAACLARKQGSTPQSSVAARRRANQLAESLGHA